MSLREIFADLGYFRWLPFSRGAVVDERQTGDVEKLVTASGGETESVDSFRSESETFEGQSSSVSSTILSSVRKMANGFSRLIQYGYEHPWETLVGGLLLQSNWTRAMVVDPSGLPEVENGLFISLSNYSSLEPVNIVSVSGFLDAVEQFPFGFVEVFRQYAFLGTQTGIEIVNTTDVFNPHRVAFHNYSFPVSDIVPDPDLLSPVNDRLPNIFLAAGSRGVLCVDFDDLQNPVELCSYNVTSAEATRLTFTSSGSNLIFALFDSDLHVISIDFFSAPTCNFNFVLSFTPEVTVSGLFPFALGIIPTTVGVFSGNRVLVYSENMTISDYSTTLGPLCGVFQTGSVDFNAELSVAGMGGYVVAESLGTQPIVFSQTESLFLEDNGCTSFVLPRPTSSTPTVGLSGERFGLLSTQNSIYLLELDHEGDAVNRPNDLLGFEIGAMTSVEDMISDMDSIAIETFDTSGSFPMIINYNHFISTDRGLKIYDYHFAPTFPNSVIGVEVGGEFCAREVMSGGQFSFDGTGYVDGRVTGDVSFTVVESDNLEFFDINTNEIVTSFSNLNAGSGATICVRHLGLDIPARLMVSASDGVVRTVPQEVPVNELPSTSSDNDPFIDFVSNPIFIASASIGLALYTVCCVLSTAMAALWYRSSLQEDPDDVLDVYDDELIDGRYRIWRQQLPVQKAAAITKQTGYVFPANEVEGYKGETDTKAVVGSGNFTKNGVRVCVEDIHTRDFYALKSLVGDLKEGYQLVIESSEDYESKSFDFTTNYREKDVILQYRETAYELYITSSRDEKPSEEVIRSADKYRFVLVNVAKADRWYFAGYTVEGTLLEGYVDTVPEMSKLSHLISELNMFQLDSDDKASIYEQFALALNNPQLLWTVEVNVNGRWLKETLQPGELDKSKKRRGLYQLLTQTTPQKLIKNKHLQNNVLKYALGYFDVIKNRRDLDDARKEGELLTRLSGRQHIVHVYYAGELMTEGLPEVVYFSEYALHGDTKKLRGLLRYASESQRVEILSHVGYCIADALELMHEEEHLVHRDIKSDNILLTANYDFRVTDFGLKMAVNGDGTAIEWPKISFMPILGPELYNHEESVSIDYRLMDMWQLGLLLTTYYNNLDDKIPFGGQLRSVGTKQYFERKVSTQRYPVGPIGELMKRLLSIDPKHRPTAREMKSILSEAVVNMTLLLKDVKYRRKLYGPLLEQYHQKAPVKVSDKVDTIELDDLNVNKLSDDDSSASYEKSLSGSEQEEEHTSRQVNKRSDTYYGTTPTVVQYVPEDERETFDPMSTGEILSTVGATQSVTQGRSEYFDKEMERQSDKQESSSGHTGEAMQTSFGFGLLNPKRGLVLVGSSSQHSLSSSSTSDQLNEQIRDYRAEKKTLSGYESDENSKSSQISKSNKK